MMVWLNQCVEQVMEGYQNQERQSLEYFGEVDAMGNHTGSH